MKVCPKCNKEHEKPGTYCSRSCANSREWSSVAKNKKSIALKKFIADNPSWKEKQAATVGVRTSKLKETLYEKNLQRFHSGEFTDRGAMKTWLIKLYGEQCTICGIGPEWNGKYLSLQVDHINGINDDNVSSNLRLVCPNCHTQTETFSYKHHRRNIKS